MTPTKTEDESMFPPIERSLEEETKAQIKPKTSLTKNNPSTKSTKNEQNSAIKRSSKVLSPVLQQKLKEETIEARAQRLTPEVPQLEKLGIGSTEEFDASPPPPTESLHLNTLSPDCHRLVRTNSSTMGKNTFNSPVIHRSPSHRRMRVRTMGEGLGAHYQLFDIASTERMKRNTDSMLEDALIANKLKRRLTSRREIGISRRTVQDSSLSEFIKKSVMESSLDALSVVHPTDNQLSHAADLALKVFLEGYFVDISNEAAKVQTRQIFLESLVMEEFHEGDYICRQNDIGDKLFIIEEGIVQFTIGDQIAGMAQNGDIFGELSLIYGTSRYAGVKAVTSSVMVWSLDTLSFRRIQALVAKEALKASTTTTKASKSVCEKLKEFRKKCSSLSDLQEKSLYFEESGNFNIGSLERNAIIGKGTFGSVYLVSLPNDEGRTEIKYYALKCMSKASIVERNNKKRVLIEKNVLQELNSNFIISLMGTHQDDSYIYFLTDFVQGGNLMSYMIKKDVLSHSECVFFSANIVSALVHIHKKGFVHRDVKPENCLIDKNGYLKLCDFGMAKRLPSMVQLPNGGTEVVTLAFTMCGTPEFMAPEFVLSTGYDKGVDIWALGCILVEMYIARSPFQFDGDLKKTFREVCLIGMGKKKFSRPEALKKDGLESAGRFAEDLLSSLQDRIGREDSAVLKEQDYYESIDFEMLEEKKITAPYQPQILNASDVSNFRKDGDRWSEESVQTFHGDKSWCENF